MKKIFTFLIMLSCIAIFVACSSEESSNESSNASEKDVDYPRENIKLIIPYAAGGNMDVTGRIIADYASDYFDDYKFVVENKEGGGAAIGDEFVANSEPDGYTLLLMGGSVMTNPLLTDVPYETEDFTPLSIYNLDSELLVVPKESDIETLDDFIEKAKEKNLKIATSGTQTPHHFAAVKFENEQDVEFDYLHADASEMYQQLLGNHVEGAFTSGGEAINLIRDGSLRAIGIMGEERNERIPDVPTFKESGIDMNSGVFRGVAAPADTPDEVIKELDKRFNDLFHDEDLIKDMQESGFEYEYKNASEAQEIVEKEVEEIKEVLPDIED